MNTKFHGGAVLMYGFPLAPIVRRYQRLAHMTASYLQVSFLMLPITGDPSATTLHSDILSAQSPY